MGTWTREQIAEANEEAILYDEYETAIIGMAYRAGNDVWAVVAYDYDKCIDILVAEGMAYDEAVEYFEYNTQSAWFGENTPLFIRTNLD